jgi:hypothetical protein
VLNKPRVVPWDGACVADNDNDFDDSSKRRLVSAAEAMIAFTVVSDWPSVPVWLSMMDFTSLLGLKMLSVPVHCC